MRSIFLMLRRMFALPTAFVGTIYFTLTLYGSDMTCEELLEEIA